VDGERVLIALSPRLFFSVLIISSLIHPVTPILPFPAEVQPHTPPSYSTLSSNRSTVMQAYSHSHSRKCNLFFPLSLLVDFCDAFIFLCIRVSFSPICNQLYSCPCAFPPCPRGKNQTERERSRGEGGEGVWSGDIKDNEKPKILATKKSPFFFFLFFFFYFFRLRLLRAVSQ